MYVKNVFHDTKVDSLVSESFGVFDQIPKSVATSNGEVSESHLIRLSYPHYHDNYEIYMLISGRCQVFIGEQNFALTPGTVSLIKPYVPHRYAYTSDCPNLRFVFNVKPDYLQKYYSDKVVKDFFYMFDNRNTIKLTNEEAREFLELAYELDEEYAKPDFGKSFLPVADIISLISNHIESNLTAENSDSTKSSVECMVEYLNRNFSHPITVDTLEKEFFIGKRTINELFKRELGTTPSAYLRDLRIKNAVFLLTKSEFTNRKISSLCGFSSKNHFYQSFTQHMKVSPSEFRKKFKENFIIK